ncbi:MAG: SLBB domain-containing protein [Thermodesulfobacteriota bacterium]
MPPAAHNTRTLPAAKTSFFLLLAVMGAALLPVTALALGGPWPIAVSVEGEVRHPGAYTLPPDATLSALIAAAGGYTDNAELRGASLVRASARIAQEAELRGMAGRVTPGAGAPEAAAEAARPVAAYLSGLRASGRIPVRLSHPRLLKNSPDDLRLEEGDALRIPAKRDSVAVEGAVRTAVGDAPHVPGLPLKGYIARAGGYAEDADREHVYLLRADGSTALLTPGIVSWNPAASRWEVTALVSGAPAIGPGDTIVVPRRLPRALPRKIVRRVPTILMRAAEISGAPALLPAQP